MYIMFHIIKLHKNPINNILNRLNSYLLTNIINFNTYSTSKLILDAHQSCFTENDKLNSKSLFQKYSDDLKTQIFSKQEAACALKFCLDLDHFDPDLFKNIIKVLEDEYFKPVLVEDSSNTSHQLYNITKHNVSSTYDFINSLSIKDKSNIIIWSWHTNKNLKKSTRRLKIPKRTEHIDPEKKEVYVTRKTGMVLDPIPIRARLSYMPPGKKLANTLSVQLREAVPKATLYELCHISHIFSTPLPLTGQLNEDTMDLIAQAFCKFETAELAKNLLSVSAFCRYASKRFLDTWSFMDPNINRLQSRARILYKFEKRRLAPSFTNKVLQCLESYTSSEVELEIHQPYLSGGSHLSAHLHILNNLTHSDIEIPINSWDGLIIKLKDIAKQLNKFEIKEIGILCDTLLKAQYTTPNTLECAKMMLQSFTTSEEFHKDDQYLLSQILCFIYSNCLNQECSEIVRSVYTLALNNIESIEFDTKFKLINYLDKLSDCLEESARLELRFEIRKSDSILAKSTLNYNNNKIYYNL